MHFYSNFLTYFVIFVCQKTKNSFWDIFGVIFYLINSFKFNFATMEENINQISEATHNQEDTNNEPDSENSIDDESGSEEDESYCEELEEDESDNESIESSSSTVSYGEVPDAFANYIAGPNAVEIEV